MARKSYTVALLAAWGAALAAAWPLMDANSAPGESAVAPPRWPASSLRLAADRPTVLLFAHPHCPCTRAGMDELAWVLARCEGGAGVVVVFALPPGAPAGWQHGESWARAGALPGARLVADRDGAEARRFGAATSGHVMVYRPDGRLVFQGGLAERNRDALLRAVRGEISGEVFRAEVFGCPLWDGR